jgi:hypothetical protein
MPRRGSSFLLVLLAVALVAPACMHDPSDSECDLVVLNASPCRLSVFVDGQQAFDVRAGSDRTLDDIGAGRHVVEAFDPGGKLVQRRTVELARGEDFYWTIATC